MTGVFGTTILAFVALCVFLAANAQAHPAWGIAVDSKGQVYFSDLGRVWKIDAQGRVSVFRGEGHTHDLNLDEAGNVYGEHDFSAIWKMTPAGRFSYLFAPTESSPKGVSIWRDRDGNMYSVEQNNHLKRETLLLKRTPGGNVSVLAGSSYGHADGKGREAKFRNIVGMTFGPDGSLYLTDGSSIRKVTMDGTVTTLASNIMKENASGGPADGTPLFGIAVDAQGNAFVADYGNQRVLKVTPDKQLTTVLRAEQSWFPAGAAISRNDLYILEHSFSPTYAPIGTRVRKLSTDGKVTVLATVGEGRVSSESLADDGSSSGETSGGIPGLSQKISYAPIGAGVGLLTLTALVVWRLRKRGEGAKDAEGEFTK